MLQKLQWDSLQQWRALVIIPNADNLEAVPVCTRRFKMKYVQIQCNTVTYVLSHCNPAVHHSTGWHLPVDSFKTHLSSFHLIWSSDYVPVFKPFYHLHCTVFVWSYCLLFAARLSRCKSAYSLMVWYIDWIRVGTVPEEEVELGYSSTFQLHRTRLE